jgi:hypothetical protein
LRFQHPIRAAHWCTLRTQIQFFENRISIAALRGSFPRLNRQPGDGLVGKNKNFQTNRTQGRENTDAAYLPKKEKIPNEPRKLLKTNKAAQVRS